MSLATVASVVGIAGGVNAISGGAITNALGMGGQSAQGAGQQAAGLADPFASSRGQYGQQLNQLMQGGPQAMQQLQNQPGYQFQLQQGLGAITAAGSATGNLGSGNMAGSLTKYASGLASQDYNNYFSQLAELSGAGWNNGAAAGSAVMNGQQNQYGQTMSGMQSTISGLASLGQQFNQPPQQTQPYQVNSDQLNSWNPTVGIGSVGGSTW